MIRYILPLLIIFNLAGAQTNEEYLRHWAQCNAGIARDIAYYCPQDTPITVSVTPNKYEFLRSEWHFAPYTGKVDSEFSAYILSIFERAYSRYEKWCADTVEKRGWDYWTTDTTRFRLDSAGNKWYYAMKRVPNYYRDRRLPPPNGLDAGFIEFLRKQR